MKYKCDKCDRPATNHAVVKIKGKNIEKHLCDECAAEDGLADHTQINDLLTNFIKLSGTAKPIGGPKPKAPRADRTCPDCGLKFNDFRDKSLLGCAGCYKAFSRQLVALLERAHEGGSQHVGKVPRRSGGGEQRQLLIARMRKRLDDAVAAENYELAARLRDDIFGLEQRDREHERAKRPRAADPAPGDNPAATPKDNA